MKSIIKSLVIVVAVAAVAGGATWAYFTSQASVTNNTFAAGTLKIVLDQNGIVNNTSTPTLPVSLNNLYPGYDGFAKGDFYYPAVANDGSLEFRWKFGLHQTAQTGANLDNVLNVRIDESLENAGPWAYPAGGTFNCQNAVIWNGSYPHTTVVKKFEGNIADYSNVIPMGNLSSQTGRCYRISFSLPTSVNNTYQGAGATYTIGVQAFQLEDPAYN